MAARITRRQAETCRAAISTTKILQRCQDHIRDPEKHPMQPSQVTLALGLLKKTLPDLSSVDQTLNAGQATSLSDADLLTLVKAAKTPADEPSTDLH